MGYLVRVRSVTLLFLQLSEAGCYAALGARSGHSGEEGDACPEVPRLLMHFMLYSQLITNPTTASEQGAKPSAVLLATKTSPGALVLSCGE